MSGLPPDHPKKKPRLDASQEPQPGPSSGAQPINIPLKQVHSSTSEKLSLPTNSLSLKFVKTGILREAHSPSSSSSSSASWYTSSEDDDEKKYLKYKKYNQSLSLKLKKSLEQSIGYPISRKYKRTVAAIKKLHEYGPKMPSSTTSEDEENELATGSKFLQKAMIPPANSTPSVPSNLPSPGFTKASEIPETATSSFLKKIEDSGPSHLPDSSPKFKKGCEALTSSLLKRFEEDTDPSNLLSPGLKKDSEISEETASFPHKIEEDSDPSNLLSPGFRKASEVSKAATSSFPHKIEEDRDFLALIANVTSSSKSQSNNCKKRKCRVHNKRRKTVISNNSKIIKYFLDSDSSESDQEVLKYVKKNPKESREKKNTVSLMKPKFSRHSGWDKKNVYLLESITDNELFFKQYQDRYGLVENSIEESSKVDYFSNLPTHIIELILCTVPILDFMNCRLVCKQWMSIIDNPRYMKWKKYYYKYKKDYHQKEGYQMIMQSLTVPLNHQPVEGCVATLVNYMGKEFNRMHSRDMYEWLLRNRHGELADQVLNERFPEWRGKDSRVWCQLAVAVLLCETVWDVLKLYQSLLHERSECLRTDIQDAFYCFALFLFHFRKTEKINCGLHYRIYYALYVIENNVPFCQRHKMLSLKKQTAWNSWDSQLDENDLTHEQIRILHHRFDIGQKIKISALAGTGKTTTIVHLARLYPEIKFLYISYNKSVHREARRKFPTNVICKTAHAVAFNAVGREFQHKLTAVIRPHDMIKQFRENHDKMQVYVYGNLVLATISNFMHSSDHDFSLQHVPNRDSERRPLSLLNSERVLKDAKDIWLQMSDCTSDVRITHDGYLKVYQLQKPILHRYQCIVVDDAQDCNPSILDIVLSQSIPVIFVGDPHQQLYGFRGARNTLEHIEATHTYRLNKSFRFGPEISYLASCMLELSLHVRDNVLVGNGLDSNLRGEVLGQFAVISRTNIALFNEAIRIVAMKYLKPYEPKNVQPFFAGGLASYGFDQLLDIYILKYSATGEKKVKDKFINRFKSLKELVDYARASDDTDLKAKIDLVNHHCHDLPNFLLLLKKRCISSIQQATVVFSTAHKSKGMEFDTVSLTDDYIVSPLTGDQCWEEANILYTAMTRAKSCLLLSEKMSKLFHAAQEKFEYPVSSRSLLKNNVELKCVQCECTFNPHTVLALVRRKIVMGGGREVSEGPLCMKCRTDPTMRPDLHLNGLIMYLDPVPDNAHRFMNSLVGPLPNDPPILHDRFNEYGNADRVFVINLNIH